MALPVFAQIGQEPAALLEPLVEHFVPAVSVEADRRRANECLRRFLQAIDRVA